MRCALHIGLQKCGSTSIQKWCAHNSQALRQHGILYPETFRTRGIDSHSNLVTLFADYNQFPLFTNRAGLASRTDFPAWKSDVVAAFDAELAAARRDGVEQCFLSQEDLSRLDATKARAVLDFLAERFDAVAVVGIVRPPAAMAQSWLSSRAQNGSLETAQFTKSFTVNLNGIADAWSHDRCRFAWIAYERFGNVVDAICAELGIERQVFDDIPPQNTSLDARAVAMLAHLRLPLLREGQRNVLRRTFAHEIPLAEKPRLSRSEASDIQSRHADTVAAVLERNDQLTRADLTVDLSEYPETANTGATEPPYIDELRYVVERLNAELQLKTIENSLLKSELAQKAGNAAGAAKHTVDAMRAMDTLENQASAAAKAEAVVGHLSRLRKRGRKLAKG